MSVFTAGKAFITLKGIKILLVESYSLTPDVRVVYAGVHGASVAGPARDGTIRIRFDDRTLIPPEMDVPIEHLTHPDGSRFVDAASECPACGVPWKETQGFSSSYWDCPRCGKRREDA